MKLLDTTFLVDLLRGDKGANKVISTNESFLTTQINMYEILSGIFYGKASSTKLLQVQDLFENIKVLSLDDNGIIRSAQINADLMHKGKIIEDCDCLTAGIALSKGITTIITRNVKHFERIKGIKVELY